MGFLGHISVFGMAAVLAGVTTPALAQSADQAESVEYSNDNGAGVASVDLVETPGEILRSFDSGFIGPILTEMEIPWQARQDVDGRPFIQANADGRLVFTLEPLACRGPVENNCVGMQLVAIFDGDADPEMVQDFNNRYAFANLGVNDLGNAYLTRYDIADYGIAKGNVAVLIDTFVGLGEIYQDLSEDISGIEPTLSSTTMSSISVSSKAGRVSGRSSSEAAGRDKTGSLMSGPQTSGPQTSGITIDRLRILPPRLTEAKVARDRILGDPSLAKN